MSDKDSVWDESDSEADDSPSYDIDYFARMVRVVVGKERQEILIPRGLLRDSAEYFKRALRKHWQRNGTIEALIELDVESVDLETFSVFLTWLYKKRLVDCEALQEDMRGASEWPEYPGFAKNSSVAEVESNKIVQGQGDLQVDRLVRAYILGNYLQANQDFQNHIMDGLVEGYKRIFDAGKERVLVYNIKHIYKMTSPGQAIRKFLTDVVVSLLPKPTFDRVNYVGLLPSDLIQDLASAVFDEDRCNHYPWLRDRCRYHDHSS